MYTCRIGCAQSMTEDWKYDSDTSAMNKVVLMDSKLNRQKVRMSNQWPGRNAWPLHGDDFTDKWFSLMNKLVCSLMRVNILLLVYNNIPSVQLPQW